MINIDELIPPDHMNFVGQGDFKKVGEGFLQHFIELGKLNPHDKILDVGCGIGRMALPLINYLDSEGSYDGFDIVTSGIEWCSGKISPRFPNFRFRLVDVYNKEYNPESKQSASTFEFPYKTESFDFVFLTSVFTHQLPPDMEHYLSEIARVLKKGGRSFITYFLLNKESIEFLDAGKSSLDFKYQFGEYRTTNPEVHEAAISYDESVVVNLYQKYGLEIEPPLHYGNWCGREIFVSYQDIIIASKPQADPASSIE